MAVLVVGSRGFIGSNLCEHLENLGHEVYGVGVSGSPTDNYFTVNAQDPNYIEIFKAKDFEFCINASGSPGVRFSIDFPEDDHRMNFINTERLLVAIKETNSKCKFVCLSSAAVYGNPKYLPIDEQHPLEPISNYGKTKLSAENLVTQFYHEYHIPSIILRIFSAYGKGLRKQVFYDMYKLSKLSKSIQLFGTGNESRDFVSVADICTIVTYLMRNTDFSGQVFNVASGVETSISYAARVFLSKLDPECVVTFNGQVKQGDPVNWVASIEKLKECGFKIQHEFETEIEKYAKWLKENE